MRWAEVAATANANGRAGIMLMRAREAITRVVTISDEPKPVLADSVSLALLPAMPYTTTIAAAAAWWAP